LALPDLDIRRSMLRIQAQMLAQLVDRRPGVDLFDRGTSALDRSPDVNRPG